MRLLHLDSSILGDRAVSRELSALIVDRLRSAAPGTQVVYRDLAAEGLVHVTPVSIPTAHGLAAASGPLDPDGEQQRRESDAILAEFLEADTIVIGAPMYNFTVPSQLKAWIDRIIIPGTTVRYTDKGPEGLAGGKRVIVAIARGGFYGKDTAMASAEHAESYLKLVFGFVGIGDVEFVVAEGLTQGEATKAKAVASAREAITQLAA